MQGASSPCSYGQLLTHVPQELHLATVLEVLSSIKQAEMTPILTRIYASPSGTELLDALMK
jgi:actin related protein 2/3 complex subunit 5